MLTANTAFPRSLEQLRFALEGDGLTVRPTLPLAPFVLARTPGRGSAAVERTVTEARARRILGTRLAYVYHESFDAPEAERTILGSPVPAAAPASTGPSVPAGLPPYLASLFRDGALLSRELETDLFRRMNYLKHRASRLREGLDPSRARPSDLDEIERLQAEALALKNQVVQANLRLVVAIAKTRVGPAADLFELISDGNMSLMQAVEKFDFARGFKFSTYASWAIMRNFARSLPAETERRGRFVTGLPEQFEVADEVHDEQDYDSDRLRRRETVQEMLGRLSDRERHVLVNRFGLDGAEKQTLVQIGQTMGITKERVRQIEMRARNKLRNQARVEGSDPSR